MKKIEVKQISFAYDEADVMKDINLTIESKEGCILLAGRNGTGKSTLLNLICGSLLPYEGSVERGGVRIGYLPFDTPLFEHLSVKDNLRYFYRNFHGKDFDEQDPMIERIIDALSIDYMNQRIDKCSSGQKQKAGIAMILMSKADFIIMDEPFVAMDTKSLSNLVVLIQEMKQDTCFLLTTHAIDQLESMTDRLVVLKEKGIDLDTRDAQLMHAYFEEQL